ncbi:unnamed protein product [Dicrocoelium dendriticum]|nr:unnamed protein product [Dicrocoelium dendriticum]
MLLSCIGDKIGSDLMDTSQWAVNIYNVRIEEGNIIDLTFLHGYKLPTFAMIYEDDLTLHLKTYEVSGREPSLHNVQLSLDSIEPTTKILIPVPKPYGGVILVGDKVIYYHTKDGPHISQYIPQAKACQVICYEAVDVQRYLLGDIAGRLYMVHLLADESSGNGSNGSTAPRIASIRIELLGETTIPESISYLDNGVVFIGSTLGDSQLIRLNPDPDPERNSYITVLESYTNIGPTVDMVLLETKGQNQLITCSGAFKEGTLRIIRNGIGIHEHATIDQDFIKGTWCFSLESAEFDDAIVVSMMGQTQLLRLTGDDISALQLAGFKNDEQTVYCTTLCPVTDGLSNPNQKDTQHCILAQATTSVIRLVGIQNLNGKGCLAEWRPPTGRGISCLNSFGALIIVASGAELYALQITGPPDQPVFQQLAHRSMSQEVACIDLSPFDHARAASTYGQTPAAPSGDTPVDYSVPHMVAVGLWLGHGLFILSLPKLDVIHEEPLPETAVSTGSALLPRSLLMAQLEDTAYLFVATGDGTLYFYTMIPAAASVSVTERKFRELEVSSLLIFNQSTLELMFAHSFHYSQTLIEIAISITSIKPAEGCSKGAYYAVGTAFLVEDEVEPSKGRIHVFHWDPDAARLDTVMVYDVNGAVYRLVDFNGRLLAAINSSVRLFDIKGDSLRLSCAFNENILVLFLRHKGDFVLAGDLMRSLTLLLFRPNVNNFEAIGRHRNPRWTTCVEILDDEHFLAAEVENNIFVVSRDAPENTQEPSVRAVLAPTPPSSVLSPVTSSALQSPAALSAPVPSVGSSAPAPSPGSVPTGSTGSFAPAYPTGSSGHSHSIDSSLLLSPASSTVFPSPILIRQPDLEPPERPPGARRLPRFHTLSGSSTSQPPSSSSSGETAQLLAAAAQLPPDNRYPTSESNGTAVTGDAQRLVDCAYFHTGDFINVIVKGNLVMQSNDERWPAIGGPAHLYGGVSGCLGLIIQISPILFAFLKEIESRLNKLISPVGGFAHDTWRAFRADRVSRMAHNFVDGDLIETLLDLSNEDKAKLVRNLRFPISMNEFGVAGSSCVSDPETRECTVADLVKVVEELARLH